MLLLLLLSILLRLPELLLLLPVLLLVVAILLLVIIAVEHRDILCPAHGHWIDSWTIPSERHHITLHGKHLT